jgi:hypothetical protein
VIVRVEELGVVFVEGAPRQPLLGEPKDASLVLEACFSAGTRAVLLYASNLTPGFFDVSSREAGEILQKLRNYRVRMAVVHDQADEALSRRFHELLAAERRDSFFNVFEDRAEAVSWLAQPRD